MLYTGTSDESWAVSWERRQSQYNLTVAHKLNVLLDGW